MTVKRLVPKDNEVYVVKPLGFNGSIPYQEIHWLPRNKNFGVSYVKCLGQSCYLCQLYSYLNESGLIEKLSSYFREQGSHFNIKKTAFFYLPLYLLQNGNWELRVLSLLDSQVISFLDFLESEKLYEVGNPSTPQTLYLTQSGYEVRFSKSDLPFLIDPFQLRGDYERFLSFLQSQDVVDLTTYQAISTQLYNLVKKALSEIGT